MCIHYLHHIHPSTLIPPAELVPPFCFFSNIVEEKKIKDSKRNMVVLQFEIKIATFKS
jgi:hypothetical protein